MLHKNGGGDRVALTSESWLVSSGPQMKRWYVLTILVCRRDDANQLSEGSAARSPPPFLVILFLYRFSLSYYTNYTYVKNIKTIELNTLIVSFVANCNTKSQCSLLTNSCWSLWRKNIPQLSTLTCFMVPSLIVMSHYTLSCLIQCRVTRLWSENQDINIKIPVGIRKP